MSFKKLLIVAVLAMPVAAMADTSIQLGTKWYFTKRQLAGSAPLYPTGGGTTTSVAPGVTASSNIEDLNANLGLGFGDAVIYVGLDFGRWDTAAQGVNSAGDTTTYDGSMFRFGIMPGLKYYFTDRDPGHISPYVDFNFFKYFTSFNFSNASDVFGDQSSTIVAAMGDMLSPVGGSGAFGIEYNFSRNFSIGADIIGLRFAHSGWTLNVSNPTLTGAQNDFTWFTTINLNFRIFGLFKVYTKEDDRAPSYIGGTPDNAPPPPPPPSR